MTIAEESLAMHYDKKGKIRISSTVPVTNSHDLSLAYTPGVAAPCLAIRDDISKSYELTARGNMCLVVTDGSAVLGLGDIGPEAGMPVMEGKCVLFKELGGVDAFPLCVKTKDVDEFVNTIYLISGSFGGINLEDISAPRCFEIEEKLKEKCDIPVFHDDQHGTAITMLAGITNAVRVVGKELTEIKVIINGAGAAATAIATLLHEAGIADITVCDRNGLIYKSREDLNDAKKHLASFTNPNMITGTLADGVRNADVFIGVSAPNVLTAEMVQTMAKDPIIFACANPTPEIMPDVAKSAGAAVVATGRSDYPNQLNNALVFPGLFRGTFDVRAKEINREMKLAAAKALAELVGNDLSAEYIIPPVFDIRVPQVIAEAVAKAARDTGAAQI